MSEFYEVFVVCSNCGFRGIVKVYKGRTLGGNATCPNCDCYELKAAEDGYKQEIIQRLEMLKKNKGLAWCSAVDKAIMEVNHNVFSNKR